MLHEKAGRSLPKRLVAKLTEPNFFVVSDAGGRLLGEEFLGEENSVLSLESFLSL